MRFELGAADISPEGGYWLPPGYPSDPSVSFALDGENASFGAIALGYDWQNGWRADVAAIGTGSADVAGPCAGASDGSPCSEHADITGASVQTRALMGSVSYAPVEARGSKSVFQPFIVGGVGIARNEVGAWTRENQQASGDAIRSFEGDTSLGLAWSVGFGASLQVTRPGKWPVILEGAWRYYDFGEASGGGTPLPGSGTSVPVAPLTFDTRDQVISIGVRIPLQRF